MQGGPNLVCAFCTQVVPIWHSGDWPPAELLLQLAALNHVPAGGIDAQNTDFEDVLDEVVAALNKMGVLPAKPVSATLPIVPHF